MSDERSGPTSSLHVVPDNALPTADEAANRSPVIAGGVVRPDCWTPARLELRAWLERNAPSLAELYEGAVLLMFVSPVPGRVRFVAHAVREIRNRLPDVISGVKVQGRLDYKTRLDGLSELWKRSGLATDGCLPDSRPLDGPATPASPDILIDRHLFMEIAALIKDHITTRAKPEDAAIRLFEGVAPENQRLRDTLRPVVRQWLAITDWFMGRAHDSGAIDADCEAHHLREQFEIFEMMLAALTRGFFSTVDDLDEILENTNS